MGLEVCEYHPLGNTCGFILEATQIDPHALSWSVRIVLEVLGSIEG